MSGSITIDYYTDILCVWAWISQPRLNELNEKWERPDLGETPLPGHIR